MENAYDHICYTFKLKSMSHEEFPYLNLRIRSERQVEDTLFRVPRKAFEEQSGVFSDLFSLPMSSGNDSEG